MSVLVKEKRIKTPRERTQVGRVYTSSVAEQQNVEMNILIGRVGLLL